MKVRYEEGIVSDHAMLARTAIATEVKSRRKELNMTQEMLAELAGTKKSNISRMESGKYNPSLDFLVKVADSMGKSVEVRFF